MGTYFATFFSVGFRAVFSLLVNKWVAWQFGTAGIVLLGQFQNTVALGTSIPTDAIQRGFVKYQSGKPASGQWLQLLFGSHLVAGLLALPTWVAMEVLLPEGTKFLLYALGAEIALLAMLFGSASLSTRQVLLKFNEVNIWQVIIGACSCAVTVIGTLFMPLHWALLIWLGVQGLPFLYYAPSFKIVFPLVSWKSLPWKQLFTFAGAMLFITLLGKVSELWVRNAILETYGTDRTGWWQAVQKISELYFVPFNAFLNLIFFTKIASFHSELKPLKAYFWKSWIVATVASFLVLLFIYVLRDWLVVLINAPVFAPAAELMPLQLLGDFLKSASYIVGMLAIARGFMLRAVLTEIFSVVLYIGLVYWQLHFQPFQQISQVHCWRYGLYLLVYIAQIPVFLKERKS